MSHKKGNQGEFLGRSHSQRVLEKAPEHKEVAGSGRAFS